jgi:AcrR family transcriptional regulator
MRQHRRNPPGHHRALVEEKLGRGPRLPAAERRAAILAAASRVFSERSYRGATTAEIARAAGISEPILYRHFTSKTDLFLACLENVWQQLRGVLDEAVAQADDPKAAMGAAAEAYMNARERVRLIDFWIQSLSEAAGEPRIRAFLKRQMREVHDYFAEGLRRSQAAGGVLPDRDPEAEAWIFIAGGLLVTIDRRLGGFLGDDIKRVKRERKRWLLGEEACE